MTEIIKLRKKPELTITLNNDNFEIVDVSDPKINGLYTFEQIKNVELNAESNAWLVSIFTWVAGLIIENTGGSYKKTKQI